VNGLFGELFFIRQSNDLIEHHVARVIVKPLYVRGGHLDGPQTEGLDFAAELQLITGAKIPTSSDGHGGRWELRTKHGRCNQWALKR
jgi:hypothetical protein